MPLMACGRRVKTRDVPLLELRLLGHARLRLFLAGGGGTQLPDPERS